MSINPETDLDLEKLFLPAWAQETSTANRYAKFTGNEGAPRERRDDRGGPRPPRRDGGGGGGAGRGFGGPRPAGQNRGPGGPGASAGPGGPRRDAGGAPRRDGPGGPRRDAGRRDDFRGAERRETPPPLPEINVSVIPDDKGVDSLARQIKVTGRAFPLFDIAHLIIQKPERYALRFSTRKNAEGQIIAPMFLCALDDTLWLNEDEAVAHVLGKHFGTFYQSERTATEPPKGVYTFVAQCGLSGVILGPPNYHDYQNQLHRLHTERFARMPFDAFKARVKIVRDEAVVKQWIDEQSWKTEYTTLNVPEASKLASREEVEKHFRATHKDTIIKPVENQVVSGVNARSLRGGLSRLVQDILAQQRRFPMQIATSLSQAFAKQGLQFFKVNKTVTHVAIARPHFLDLETTPVSDGVKKIVDFINNNPKCTRRKLVEALAPSPKPAPIPVAPPVEGEAAAPATAPAAPEPTAEQTAVVSDLHWLVHQGHVIEFANGSLDTAKKPLPKPPKPEKKAAPKADAKAGAPTPEAAAEIAEVEEAEAAAETEGMEAPAAETQAAEAPAAEAPAAEAAPESPAPATPSATEPPATT